jgi:SET family sugar efflux transporter-like MFS transporter
MGEWPNRVRAILSQPGFAGLLASSLAVGFGSSFVGPFLSLWGTQAIGMRPPVFGMYMTATTLSAIVVATTLARWSDTHLPRKVMLLLGGCGGVAGYAAYAFLREPRVLVCIACTALALAALCFSQLFAYAREHYYDRDIPGVPPGFLMSVVRVCFSIAWTTGPSLAAWIVVKHGFTGLFLGAAALYLFFVAGIARYVPYQCRPAHVRAAVREPVWRVLTRGDLLAVFVAFLAIYAAHTMNAMNLPLMLTEGLGGTSRDVGIAFGVGPLAEIPLMLWFAHLASRGHTLALLRFGGAITVLYFLLLNRVTAPWQVFLLQPLHGTSFAIISNVGILFFQDLVPGQPGLATTVFANATTAGNLLGFFAFGSLVQPLGNRGLFLASAGLTFLMAAILFLYRPGVRGEALSRAAV